ncbi:hypothetical protein HFO56_00280 [Rhizobium laguerreae]|uniref:class I SAM-dependent methyltransferase n=1 Tax=Rhizobium laguerreae TaxID=1076926 RepID=UPI001C920AD0|nr:class I SAM-dependent methyltransferase [Rhizobium laguerreae]MBY3150865.1 hypothetical protein [Rhizobium laguerreae]
MHSIEEHEAYLSQSRLRYRENGAAFMHSLSNVKEFILKLVVTAGVRSVCEIGSEGGLLSQELHRRYKEGLIDRLTIVDPVPSKDVAALADDTGCSVERRLSLDALEGMPAHDLYIVDGDHNYHTVTHELRAIFRHESAIVVMHDIGWPCATRDMYYNPETVPADARHSLTFDGAMDPAKDEIVASGLDSHGYYAVSLHDGGVRNGVFTALKDVSTEFDLEFDSLPALLGVGVVRRASHPSTAAIRDLFPSAEIDALLWRLEENRLSNWVAKTKVELELHQSKTYQQGLEDQLAGGISFFFLAKLVAKVVRRRLTGR